jgi:anti-sigma factor RsiW
MPPDLSQAMNGNPTDHLNADLLQALSEGLLDEAQALRARGHLAVCPRCQGEWEAWNQLFQDLNQLPDFMPAAGFSERVLLQLGRVPVAARDHLAPPLLQDLVDGALSTGQRRKAEAHLAACATCREELGAWTALVEGLRDLPEASPSARFEGEVLAAWRRIQTPPPHPTSAWALIAGLLAAPTLGALAIVGGVVLHPLLSLSGLLVFSQWKAAQLLERVGAWGIESLVRTLPLEGMSTLASPLWDRPALLLALSGATWALAVGAAWVLYRQLTPSRLHRDAHAPLPH